FLVTSLHRRVHSFPTRRSSDLGNPRRRSRVGIGHDTLFDTAGTRGLGQVPSNKSDVTFQDAKTPSGCKRAAARIGTGLRKNLKADRKSTRLNSSHEWISYAVCC